MTRAPHESQSNDTVVAEFPLSMTQERCWILDQMNPGEPALNVAVRWELRGQVTAESIERAFAYVIDRHEILRTRLVERDGLPIQQVVSAVPFRIGQFDLRTTPAEDRLARIDAIAHEEANNPFDLTQPCLIRASLVRFEAERAMLLIVAHQSVFDGYSIGVLGREIGTAAAAIEAGAVPDLPELPLQYGDYSMWQREHLDSGVLEEEGDYWCETLRDAPYFEVPTDHPRPMTASTEVSMSHRPLPDDFATKLQAAAREYGVTPFTFGAGVVAACLHRLTGADEVLTGTQIAGRMDVDLEPLIGVFINNLVLRQPTPPKATLADQIDTARGVVEGALSHQSMPFNRLVGILNPPRDASRNPLVSINFNLLEVFMRGARYGDFELISVPSHAPGSVYDLEIVAIGRPEGGWRLTVEYRTDLFEEDTIEDLLSLVNDGFHTAFTAPETPISALTISPALENRVAASTAERALVTEARSSSLPAKSPDAAREAQNSAESLAEILTGHAAVREAYVPSTAEISSCAFVVPSETYSGPLNQLADELLRYVDSEGSGVEMPEDISLHMALPRNPVGDVDEIVLAAFVKERIAKTAKNTARPSGNPKKLHPPSEKIALLADIWADILGVDSVAPEDSFFDLGGHSLTALQMISQVREKTGAEPHVATLFEAPQLVEFAAHVFEDKTTSTAVAAPDSKLQDPWERIAFRESDGDLAVYTINHPFLYLKLADELPANVSVYNLNMFSDNIEEKLRGREFEDIAADAVDHILKTRSSKSVALVGLCVNAVMSMEIARQLKQQEVTVRFVGLVDSWAPNTFRKLKPATQIRVKVRSRIFRVLHLTSLLLRRRLSVVHYMKHFRITLALMRVFRVSSGQLTDDEMLNGVVTDLLVKASRNLDFAEPIESSVHLFRSKSMHPIEVQERFGWIVSNKDRNEVIELPGWHEEALTEDGISMVAAKIMRANEPVS